MSERGPRGFPGVDGQDGKDGKDADPAVIAQLVREAVAAIPRPADGKSVTVEDVEPTIAEHIAQAVSKLPRPADGKSVTVDELRPIVEQAVAAAVAALPKPKNGKDGADGKDGKRGPIGPMPDHRWIETELQFQTPDGGWGPRVDLRGPKGDRGAAGVRSGGGGGGSGSGMTSEERLQLQTLLAIFGGWISSAPAVSIASLSANDLEVTADGTASGFYTTIPGGQLLDAAYEWDWGDGSTSGTVDAVHTYSEDGTYTVSFRARNHIGWSDPVSQEITVAAGAGLWTPAELTADHAWYVSDDPGNSVIGGLLDTLADKGNTALPASTNQGVSTNRAALTNTLNGRAVWSVDSASSSAKGYLRSGSTDLARNADGCSLFAVFRSAGEGMVVLLDNSNGYYVRAGLHRGGGANSLVLDGRRLDSDGYAGIEGISSDLAGWGIAAGVIDYSGASARLYLNGSLIAQSDSFQTSGNTSDTASLFLTLGHYTNFSNAVELPLDGDMAEVVVVRGPMSTTDRQLIEGYLAWQWGLEGSLPVDHPFKSAAPTL